MAPERSSEISERFDRIDKRFEGIERRLETLDTRQHTNFLWLVGIQLTGFAGAVTGFSAFWWQLNKVAVAVAKLGAH